MICSNSIRDVLKYFSRVRLRGGLQRSSLYCVSVQRANTADVSKRDDHLSSFIVKADWFQVVYISLTYFYTKYMTSPFSNRVLPTSNQ